MKLFNRVAGRLGVTGLLVAAAFTSLPAVAADNWRGYTYNAVATVTSVKGLNAMIEQIQKETNGQLTIRLNLGGTLPISAANITQAVSDNVVQFGDDASFVGNVPVGGVSGIAASGTPYRCLHHCLHCPPTRAPDSVHVPPRLNQTTVCASSPAA